MSGNTGSASAPAVHTAIDLSARPCLVVGGAGGGIGTAIALAAAERGAAVGVITHNETHADEIVERIRSLGGQCSAVVADVTDADALVAAVSRIRSELGPIRHLVNVIGGSLKQYRRVADFDMATFDRLITHNLRYAVVSCREVANDLIRSNQTGSIVNISSGASRGASLLSAYGAAKAGLESFSRTMALEWGPYGIRVNVVVSGTIRTPHTGQDDFTEAAQSIPLRRRGDPFEIAAATLFLLSDLSSYITGETLAVDGGSHLGHPGGEQMPAFVGRRDK